MSEWFWLVKTVKIIMHFMSSKEKNIFFLWMYKMYLISAEGYENANVDFLTIKTTSEIWVSMKDVGSGMGVKNISDLVLKEIYGICEKIILQKNKLMNIKWQKEKELNTKNNFKKMNDIMTTIIKRCRGEKTRGIRAIDGFRNKLMIPDSEIPKCPEFEVKSKIGKIFKNQNLLEEYFV